MGAVRARLSAPFAVSLRPGARAVDEHSARSFALNDLEDDQGLVDIRLRVERSLHREIARTRQWQRSIESSETHPAPPVASCLMADARAQCKRVTSRHLLAERGALPATLRLYTSCMPQGKDGGAVTIAHISDIHCGGPDFVPELLERAISEINGLEPDIVICSGDLTTFGFKHEYVTARGYLDQIACDSVVVIPGNHDSRNVGYVHFEDLFGDRSSVLRRDGVTVVAVDSTEPDLDHGQIGRGRYRWIEEQFASSGPDDLRIFVLHHHLLPVPGTGRERNVVYDAGDCIECLQRAGVDLVLSGHKHVPYAWRLENLFVVNAGTVSSRRLRGRTRPCYNVIEVVDRHVDVWRKYPFHGQERIIQFSTETLAFEKYTTRIEDEVTART